MSIKIEVTPYAHEQVLAVGRFLLDYGQASKEAEGRMRKDADYGPRLGAPTPNAFVEVDATPAPSDPSPDEMPRGSTREEAHAEPEKPKPRGRPRKEPAPPAAPVPTPAEVKAQDEADEAAEIEADEPAEVPADDAPVTYTRDDLRKILGTYGSTFGMDAAMADMPKMLGFANVTATPDEHVSKAVVSVQTAIASNPYGREKAA